MNKTVAQTYSVRPVRQNTADGLGDTLYIGRSMGLLNKRSQYLSHWRSAVLLIGLGVSIGGCGDGELTTNAVTSQPTADDRELEPINQRPGADDLLNDGVMPSGELLALDIIDHAEPEPPMLQGFVPIDPEPEPEPEPVESEDPPRVERCDFHYPTPTRGAHNGGADERGRLPQRSTASPPERPAASAPSVQPVAYLEPQPDYIWTMPVRPEVPRLGALSQRYGVEELTMPGYRDELPLFERGGPWFEPRRCYELPHGAFLLTQAQAYDLYVDLVRETLWFEVDQTPGVRNIVGVRGAFPGTFAWHGDRPNRFNDTIVLLWRDADDRPHVREFPVNTGTGAYNFGYHSSSSIKPNRYYPYENGWHRSYNALRMALGSYPVRDDTNKNGHWDGDRNGWLSDGAEDHDRLGSGHNVHMGSVEGDLKDVPVNRWSAGCQVIPGSDNWIEFIGNAWTQLGDTVHYYLVDARDIAATTWSPCEVRDGSHDCPHQITTFPYGHSDDTRTAEPGRHDVYNCSSANEGGAEKVYVLNIRERGTLSVEVAVDDEDRVDPDIHLLWGDDANACLARGHRSLEAAVTPGRYLVVVDTWVNEAGQALSGEYALRVDFR